MSTTPTIKIASARHGVRPASALAAKDGSMTVQQILARQNTTQRRGASGSAGSTKSTSSVWDGILMPSARSTWLMPGLEWVTPEYVERVLAAALTGESPEEEHALYSLMMQTWPKLVANVAELKNAVCDLVWSVQNPERMELMGHLAERCRDGMRGDVRVDGQGWRGTVAGLLDGWFTGIAIREIDWEARGCRHMPQAWLPRQTRRVHARYYGWAAESGTLGLRQPGGDALCDITPHKFLVAVNNVGFGHPSGGALLRSLAWFWCASNFTRDWLLNFAQLFGQPIRWATYDTSDPTIKDRLEEMLEHMGSAAWAAAPQGANLELKEPSNKGSDNPQNQMIGMADTACDLLILGQTLTSSPGAAGSRALGEVHYNVRSDIINAAAAWAAEVLNEQLLPAVYALNVGDGGEDAVYPYYDPSTKTVDDPNARVDRVIKIMGAGIPLSKAYVYEMIEAPAPGAGEELFEAAADDKAYPKALALTSMITNGLPVGLEFAYKHMGIPRPQEGEVLVTPPAQAQPGQSAQSAQSPLAMMGKVWDRMPAQAREYYLAKLREADREVDHD